MSVGQSFTDRALLDTGSEVCLMGEDLFKLIPNHASFPSLPSAAKILDANGAEIIQTGPVILIPLRLGTKTFHHPVHIISNSKLFLLGMCLFRQARMNLISLGGHSYQVLLGDHIHPSDILIPQSYRYPSEIAVHLQSDYTLLPGETRSLPCFVSPNSRSPQTLSLIHI